MFCHLVGFLDLRTEARDGHQIDVTGKLVDAAQVWHFKVAALVLRRRHPGQSEQTEAGQRGNAAIAFDETGERQAERGQFGITGAQSAHGDEDDSQRLRAGDHRHGLTSRCGQCERPINRLAHGSTSPASRPTAPLISVTTGKKKR